MLKIVGISEQIYYYRKKHRHEKKRVYNGGRPIPGFSLNKQDEAISDLQIQEWLGELASGEEAIYGYRKLTVLLRRQYGLLINKKKVYRLCKEINLLQPQRKIKAAFPRKIACNRAITASNQLWEIDIKYGFVAGEQRFFFLLSILDVYDRSIVDYHIGLSCESRHATQTIQRALLKRQQYEQKKLPVLRTDNGPQFISHVFGDFCESNDLEHERIPPRTPNKNAHIESFHSALERECLIRHEFKNYQEAYETVINYIDFYNKRRIHGRLFDLAPHEFFQATLKKQISSLIVNV
ncbi:IS3 family transposase [Croceifilum oryzae]|uniref:IS3 family transposase n=1 Tax=Croceifilum oryzae TaxID=1553429 RepID=UPI0027D89D44|nr:IS3 family transposase [Croceifilum oryzae]